MFDLTELSTLRSALEFITVKGSDVQRVAALQIKIENEIIRIQKEIEAGPPELRDKEDKKNLKKSK